VSGCGNQTGCRGGHDGLEIASEADRALRRMNKVEEWPSNNCAAAILKHFKETVVDGNETPIFVAYSHADGRLLENRG
jgi:hypothetical protein